MHAPSVSSCWIVEDNNYMVVLAENSRTMLRERLTFWMARGFDDRGCRVYGPMNLDGDRDSYGTISTFLTGKD